MEYNGWTNYETWLIKAYIDNDQETQEYWGNSAKESFDRAGEMYSRLTRAELAAIELGKEIKFEHFSAWGDRDGVDVYSQLVKASLDSVNWDEIAKCLIDVVLENRDGL